MKFYSEQESCLECVSHVPNFLPDRFFSLYKDSGSRSLRCDKRTEGRSLHRASSRLKGAVDEPFRDSLKSFGSKIR